MSGPWSVSDFIAWWCGIIGVSDPVAISVATGIVSASVILVAFYMLLLGALWSIAAFFGDD